jgi:hypothetical protein
MGRICYCIFTWLKNDFVCTVWANKLTAWSRVLLERLTANQLVKKLSAFYGSRKFFIMFARTRHWTPSWTRWIQSTHSHPISRRTKTDLNVRNTDHIKVCKFYQKLIITLSLSKFSLKYRPRFLGLVGLHFVIYYLASLCTFYHRSNSAAQMLAVHLRYSVTSKYEFQIAVFWVVTPCSDVVRYHHFGGPCCLHLQDEEKLR